MSNISGFGIVVNIIASATFPVGVPITQFADDADPLDFAPVNIADMAIGLNGDPIDWSKPTTFPMTLNVIPGSQDDINLGIIADANRVGQGKNSANDAISATIVYPDGSITTLSAGKMISAPFGRGVSSAGRQKTRTYSFTFGKKV